MPESAEFPIKEEKNVDNFLGKIRVLSRVVWPDT